jgi:YHS domain-containing protein
MVLTLAVGGALIAADSPTPEVAAQKADLGEFNALIGKWRGVGQPRRGSNQGAWKEDAEWVWDFSDHGVAVRYDVSDGKLMKSARLTSDGKKDFTLALTTPDDKIRTYRGKEQDGKLVLDTEKDEAGDMHRITVTRLNEKRTLVLFEKRSGSQASFSRVAEVGYTREGTRLAGNSSNGPECIVTGGTGTIEVSYKGKTYYVCCTGCKQAFDDDPEGVIAEAEARHKKEREEAMK